ALREPPSTITTAVAVSCTRSNKGANRVKKRKILAPHRPCLTISACVQTLYLTSAHHKDTYANECQQQDHFPEIRIASE
ncbi:hypothetical protein DBR06_SOUSAS29610014, partial [Sousa chinensis]